MRRIGLVVDPRFRLHATGAHHPERPDRTAVLEALFDTERYRDFARVEARIADEEELRRVHEQPHVAAVAASRTRPHTQFDADTPAGPDSFEAARLAAGGAIALADAIMAGDVDAGFAALRPPGHHAEQARAMGFCLFNNVAIVARHLQARHGLARVLVVDWDVHHGNGTQHSFYRDSEVLYVSTHQYPFYPGTGSPAEVGSGAGAGFNVNVPMSAGAGSDDFAAAFRDLIVPIAESFEPSFVLVSAGFDAHRDDPLASLELGAEDYGAMTDALVAVADASAKGRVLLLLEGGYDLGALASSVDSSLRHLAEPEPFAPSRGELSPWACRAREALSAYWERI